MAWQHFCACLLALCVLSIKFIFLVRDAMRANICTKWFMKCRYSIRVCSVMRVAVVAPTTLKFTAQHSAHTERTKTNEGLRRAYAFRIFLHLFIYFFPNAKLPFLGTFLLFMIFYIFHSCVQRIRNPHKRSPELTHAATEWRSSVGANRDATQPIANQMT